MLLDYLCYLGDLLLVFLILFTLERFINKFLFWLLNAWFRDKQANLLKWLLGVGGAVYVTIGLFCIVNIFSLRHLFEYKQCCSGADDLFVQPTLRWTSFLGEHHGVVCLGRSYVERLLTWNKHWLQRLTSLVWWISLKVRFFMLWSLFFISLNFKQRMLVRGVALYLKRRLSVNWPVCCFFQVTYRCASSRPVLISRLIKWLQLVLIPQRGDSLWSLNRWTLCKEVVRILVTHNPWHIWLLVDLDLQSRLVKLITVVFLQIRWTHVQPDSRHASGILSFDLRRAVGELLAMSIGEVSALLVDVGILVDVAWLNRVESSGHCAILVYLLLAISLIDHVLRTVQNQQVLRWNVVNLVSDGDVHVRKLIWTDLIDAQALIWELVYLLDTPVKWGKGSSGH